MTTDYTYPSPKANQPHRLDGWSRTDNTGTTTGSYTYDESGNTTTRPGPAGPQTLTWTVEGQLDKLTDSTGTNSYTYDASGNRLIAKDATGSTLFLGDQEVRRNASTGQVTATRYYSFNGETIAQRTLTGITWLASDHQGTAQVSVANDTNQTITQRRQTPYGAPRGAAVSWPNKQGFLGGYQDPTGLTHLGAREYDPTIGRFISVDPVNDPGNPQQLPAYTYAANNPTTYSDPSGRIIAEYARVDEPGGNWKQLCSGGITGYECQAIVEDGKKNKQTRRDKGMVNNKAVHELLDGLAFIPGLGVAADGANTALFIYEGDYGTAAEALMPGPSICAAARSVCKKAEKELADKAQALIGRATKGKVDPKINPGKDASEMAQIKSEARDKGFSVTPKPPTVPGKKPDAGNKGKPAKNDSGTTAKKEGCKHSFDPATPVLMADGSARPIAEVAEGDEVLAHDPEIGVTSAQAVEALHVNQDEALTDLSVRTEDGTYTTLKTTQHHPFWSDSRREWVDAADLRPTERLKSASGDVTTVAEVFTYQGDKVMRDLTVANIHTYYVLAGTTPVLVHNCPSGVGGDEAAEATVRMRHYTNSRGAAGIMESGVIKASDQNKVFMVPARGKPMSPRDAEDTLGIGRGRGRKVIEFDVPASSVSSRSNPTMGITEWVADGDLPISNARVVR
ncbi:polymorphic toxin-type HINT domain-containing protein [Micromonospora sp. WMMD1120]|uniref:HYD1 signature containing ADP-ribosyltransferase family protein n=1 Tax=Micromonospora sp. WMMD1120 TaxID=3016106 RepID=UPI0024159FA5|nr:HYD1 signature containing ADP-ribosyltransferase family protein [Micromonospora sp. WMMD1120]MDG4808711.1 polymorphic toxin-type HINT domain-containing protein [Micromonospora sp. WMMD1120]